MSSLQSLLDRYDLDAAIEAFVAHQRTGNDVGSFFKDRTGVRWKYIAQQDEDTYIASHGDVGVVFTFDRLADGKFTVTADLKKLD